MDQVDIYVEDQQPVIELLITEPGGIPDVANDDIPYVRRNKAWENGNTYFDADGSAAAVQTDLNTHKADADIHYPDALANNSYYARRNNAWAYFNPDKDVSDLGTQSGSAGDYVRVKTEGGLEYRIPSQVLIDIGAEPVGSAQTVQDDLNAHKAHQANPHNTSLVNLQDTVVTVPLAEEMVIYRNGRWRNLVALGGVNGVCPLGPDGRVPPAYATSQFTLIGGWDAALNDPDIGGTAPHNDGDYWIVVESGSTDLNGITTWNEGDWALYSIQEPGWWIRVPHGNVVTSVFGRQGAIVAEDEDYHAELIVFDPTGTSLMAVRAGSAIKEVQANLEALTAAQIAVDDTGFYYITATNLQEAVTDTEANFTKVQRWKGEWGQVAPYKLGDEIRLDFGGDLWLMIANKDTSQSPQPVSSGPPAYTFPENPTWELVTVTGDVATGFDFTLDEMLDMTAGRIWIDATADEENTIQLYDYNNPATPVLIWTAFVDKGQAAGWYEIAGGGVQQLYFPGDRFRYIRIHHVDLADMNYSGTWDFFLTGAGLIPASGQAIQVSDNVLRIHYEETLGGPNRQTDLLQLKLDDTITITEVAAPTRYTTWRLTGAAIDQTLYAELPVAIMEQGSALRDNRLATIDWTARGTPQQTDYVRIVDGLLDPDLGLGGLVKGFVTQNSNDLLAEALVLDDNIYGLDIEAVQYLLATDWDVKIKT